MSRKNVHSKDDLAIHGTPPAFERPLHVGQPSVGDREKFLSLVNELLDRAWLTNDGPLVQAFERRIAKHIGVKHCVAICNGTVALEVAVRALGLTGEVIVPSYTFIATAHALHWQGITPVFADIDPHTHNLDPDAVRRMISPRTTGIIGVHLWGRPAPINALQEIAKEYGLQLMFDAAQAFGCSHAGQPIGQFGRCEVLSFHATKVFNTMEGGAVVTNDDDLAQTIRLMRNFGFSGYDNVIYPGTNGKMTEISAAMGLTNLDALPRFVEANRRAYHAYQKAFAGINGLNLLQYDESNDPSYHYVVVEIQTPLAATRDEIVATLHAENVLARKYFWPGCHNMAPYRTIFPDAERSLPVTKRVSERVFVLPNGSNVSAEDAHLIGQIILHRLAPT